MQTEVHNCFEGPDEISKKGLCWFELKSSGMPQWADCRPEHSGGQKGDSTPQISPCVIDRGDEGRNGAVTVSESHVSCRIQKRKHLSGSQEEKTIACEPSEHRESSGLLKRKQIKRRLVNRWSTERYKSAEQNMLDIMKAEGAVFGKPISRNQLRIAARKRIGDTGLLDHLLKHIDGKVAPGGVERFRRCYNTSGVMEYWLENADLVNIKRESGVQDPNWVPPSWWKPDSVAQESGELDMLKEEIAKMKRDMQELMSKKKEQEESNAVEEMNKEYLRWKARTDQHIMEISNSLTLTQDMYKGLATWKTKIEQQLMGVTNSLSDMQASKGTNLTPATDRWEDWLENGNLYKFQGQDFESWLEHADLTGHGIEDEVHGSYSNLQSLLKPTNCQSIGIGVKLVNKEPNKRNRDVNVSFPAKQDEDQDNMTPDSSLTASLKPDNENFLFFSQEMFKELMAWKTKIEQQVMEISDAVLNLQSSRKYA